MSPNERAESLQLIKSVIEPGVAQLNEQISEFKTGLTDRIVALEQGKAFGTKRLDGPAQEDLTAYLTKADPFKALMGGSGKSCRVDLPAGMLSAQKAAIINATQNTSQPLVQGQRIGMVQPNEQRLFVRDVIPASPTGSNLIEFTRENVYTNNAGPQYASPARENVAKNESGITFTLETAIVVTLAHFIPVSKQVLSDSSMLQPYINRRLMYGLKLEEEDEIVNGDGTAGKLSGILKSGNFVAAPAAVSGDNRADVILRAITAMAMNDIAADTIVMDPEAWQEIMLLKDEEGNYLVSTPGMGAPPMLWNKRVIPSKTIASGDFLVAAFAEGCQVFDREQASIQVSFEHSDNFTKNMATILAEERLALAVFKPQAFRKGTF